MKRVVQKKWLIKRNNPFWKKKITPDTLVKGLLWNRGIKEKEEIRDFLKPLLPAKIEIGQVGISKSEVAKARRRIQQAKEKKEGVLVYGDYDADGFCGAALLLEGLYFAGVKAIPYIPDRIKDGYGLNASRVAKIKKKIANLKLVITVDNGIVANEAVKAIKKLGIETIIVDHHVKGKSLPSAEAIIHTTQLSGSGVAWFLLRELADLGVEAPDLGLAALGTVADLLPVTKANRSLIKYGVPCLERTRRVGLRHLFKNTGIDNKPIDTFKISYIIAPRLNALGRIADPLDGLRLLCVRRLAKGEALAKLAQQINLKRQKMTADSFLAAKNEILKQDEIPPLVFVSNSDFHQGIVGLIAGKLADEFYRPAIVIKKEKGVSHGSGRSIKGFNLVQALKKLGGLLIEVGGHPMAVGFKVEAKKIPEFKKRLLSLVRKELKGKKLLPRLKVDGRLSLSEVKREYYEAICQLAPFGLGNPLPNFLIEDLQILETKQVGNNGHHLKLFFDDPKTPVKERIVAEAIGFNLGNWGEKLLPGDLVDVVASIDENIWMGRRKIILKVEDLRLKAKVVK